MLKSISFELIGDQRLVCQSCEKRVERLLKALPGVSQIRAKAQNQRIEVLFDPAVLDPTAVAEHLAKAGYEARIVGAPPAAPGTERRESLAGSSAQGRGWVRSLLLVPGALLPLLPSATCPACLAGYAALLSAAGLGFLLNGRVLTPLIGVFLAIGIASIAWSTRGHRRPGPLLATVFGSAAVVAGRLAWNIPIALYGGVALLLGASLWNLWLKRSRAGSLVQIQQGSKE